MATKARKTKEAMLAEIERPQSEHIVKAEFVQGRDRARSPISVRLSAPLLERIDRLARTENRKRGNMIQHILWEYVRSRAE